MGLLITLLEPYIPDFIKQSVRYGKHAHKGQQDQMVQKLEVPKSWFSHFYVFALLWSWGFLYLAVNVYFMGGAPSELMLKYLDFSCGDDRSVESEKFINPRSFYFNLFCYSIPINFFDCSHTDGSAVYSPFCRDSVPANILQK